jgi:hypothetical protein
MEKLDRLGWVVHRAIGMGELTLQFRSTSEELGSWLDHSLAPAIRPIDGRGDFEPHYSLVVADPELARAGRRAHILYRATSTIVRSFHLPTVVRALIQELESYEFLGHTDAVYAEASILRYGERTALIPSHLQSRLSKYGKAAEAAGITLGSARHLRVDLEDGLATPLPRTLDIAEDTWKDLSRLSGTNGTSDRFSVEEPTSVDALFVSGNIPHVISPISRSYIVRQLAVASTNLHLLRQAGLDALARLVGGAGCFALEVSSRPKHILDAMAYAMSTGHAEAAGVGLREAGPGATG